MDEAEAAHTDPTSHISHIPSPSSSSSTQDGLSITELGSFSRKMWESSATFSLWTLAKENPVVLGAARAGTAALCVPQALGQPRSSPEPSWARRGNGKHGTGGKCQQGKSSQWDVGIVCSIQPLHPQPWDAQAGLGMLQLLPALLQTPGMHPLPESLALREVRKC